MKTKNFYFFIGTEAEFIKLLPVLREFEKRKISYKIIASGQNDILKSDLLKLLNHKKIDIVLFTGIIKQTAPSLFFWFFKTIVESVFILKKEFQRIDRKNTVLIIHGDTISTVMGALLGKYYSLTIAHVEAGLRSFNYLHPFPEEIDRVIASQFTSIHFCPNQWAVDNLKKKEGVKINTFQNTLLESLKLVINSKVSSSFLDKVKKEKYFVFIIHRQENLFNEKLVNSLIDEVIINSKKIKCVFVVHKPTIVVLQKMKLFEKVKTNKNILLTERLSYVEFMKLLSGCEYLITDGGSNQEESYYLGKPCLILREHTERIEGLDQNVVLSKNTMETIRKFFNNYKKFARKSIKPKVRPSKIIADCLTNQN
jgi:UDP-N-acetylglucosamine 2-epimerase (non-hydrolysing)